MKANCRTKSPDQQKPLSGNKIECLEAQRTKHMKTTTDENISELAGRIQDHESLVESEMTLIMEASDLIRQCNWIALTELSHVFECPENHEHEALMELLEESTRLLELTARTQSEKAGYAWAQTTEDIGFLTALLDTWSADDDGGDTEYLLESRWPELSLNWSAFADGACRAHNEATDCLTEGEEFLERMDDIMSSDSVGSREGEV